MLIGLILLCDAISSTCASCLNVFGDFQGIDLPLFVCRYVLGRLSPLLSGVLAVENGIVAIDVTPKNLMSPAESYHFRIDPLRWFPLSEEAQTTSNLSSHIKIDQAMQD